MSATFDTWAGRLGLASGACAVAVWLAVAGMPATPPAPSASVRLGTLATGELDVSPLAKPVLAATSLRPGDGAASGAVRVRNQTARKVRVSLRTTAAGEELARSAWIEVRHGKRRLMRTSLAGSRTWSQATVGLDPGQARVLNARVWIPRQALDGWQAGRANPTLEFRTRAAKS